MITKQELQKVYQQELALTAKVLRAVPEGQLDFKPHERSNTTKDLFRTFIGGLLMDVQFIKGEIPENTMQKVPEFDFVAEGVGTFETKAQELLAALENATDDDLQKPLSVWGMDTTRGLMLLMMMNDMIHHRGQLTVYIRMAGGLVPSIYGPSADDKGGF